MVDLTAQSIAIVGGGIGGLTCALAFASRGAKVALFERAPTFKQVGAGIQITPNAARVLTHLGLDARLAQAGAEAQAVVPMDGMTGRALARFDLSGKTPPYRFMHRAALIAILAEAARNHGVKITMGAEVFLGPNPHELRFSNETGTHDISADLVVFADGLHSVGRPIITPTQKPFFTGQVAWRAVVDHPDEALARIWMLPGRHVVTYPLSNGRLNIVAVQERAQWAAEGWNHPDRPENLRAAFAQAAPELREILGKVAEVNLWGLFRHDIAPVWHDAARVILGDAAHPTLPFLAQGANLAIEDGYVLANCVAGAASIVGGLDQYQTARKPRVARAIAAANANAVNYHLGGIRRRIAHLGLRGIGTFAPDAFTRRLDWLYEFDLTKST